MKTELMLRYETETGNEATFSYSGSDGYISFPWSDKDTRGFIDWCKDEASRLYLENTELQRQLTWRDAVGDPPEEDGFYLIKSIDERLGDCTGASWYRGCQFINIGDKETVTHWLPIPKE